MMAKTLLALAAGLALTTQAYALSIGLVLDKGGRDDKSFNSAAYQGALEAEKYFKAKGVPFKLKIVEAKDDNAFEGLLRNFAKDTKDNYDLIVSVGFSQAEAVKKVAPLYKNKSFLLIDSQVDAPNVRSVLFEEHEGSFLVGALAGLTTKTNKVGFIGGMDIPLIRRFQAGYQAGLKYTNPKATVVANFIGLTSDAWNNPTIGKEIAKTQFRSGADITFSAAGASNAGVFEAAEQDKKLAVGCDSNQNWVKPGTILTSMLKRVDLAVYHSILDAEAKKFTAGIHHEGLKTDGVGIAVDQYNKSLISDKILKQIEEIKTKIVAGKIIVPSKI